MNLNPTISFIVLNYNQVGVTSAFLDSCNKLTYGNIEIILVDNHSENDPTELFKKKYPFVKFIRTRKNLGFTGGNNLAFRYSKGEFIFIVNNDTELTPNILNELLMPFSSPEVGVVCPKIKFYEDKEIIQYAGFNKINKFTGRNSAVGSREKDNGQFDIPGFTHYAHGAAMLVRRDIIEKVGLFPEFFFIYYEEFDFSERVKKAGYKIFYQPSAIIYHKESITMGKESAIKTYYMTRNRILFMRRNSSNGSLLVFFLFFVLLTIPKSTIEYTLKLKFEHLLSFHKAVFWNLFNKSNKL